MIPRSGAEEFLGSLTDGMVVPRVAVVGVGGAGCNLVSKVRDRGLEGIDTMAINSDAAALLRAEADAKLLITGLRGATAEAARAASEAQWDGLVELFTHDLVILAAGLGGAVGSGVAPVVAQAAVAKGATVMALAILPFKAEGRRAAAEAALKDLREAAQSVLVMDNESLVAMEQPMDFQEAIARIDAIALQVLENMASRIQDQVVAVPERFEALTADLSLGPEEMPLGVAGGPDLIVVDVPPLSIGPGGLIL